MACGHAATVAPHAATVVIAISELPEEASAIGPPSRVARCDDGVGHCAQADFHNEAVVSVDKSASSERAVPKRGTVKRNKERCSIAFAGNRG